MTNVSFGVEKGEYGPLWGNQVQEATLLNILATLDRPTAGSAAQRYQHPGSSPQGDCSFSRDNLGFVFQDFNLLDTFSIQDNILLPLVLANTPYYEMENRLRPLARQLGIEPILAKYPYEVSGGEKQRTAIARALITRPQLVLADEPTGALDSRATDSLLRLFREINDQGQTILMVTHSTKAACFAKRVLFIKDGEIFHQLYKGSLSEEEMYQKISDTLTMIATGGVRRG